MISADKLSVERNTAYFSNKSLHELEDMMHTRTYQANELILHEGDELNKLFFVKQGTIKLSKLNDEGKNLVFHYFFPMDLFGEFNAEIDQSSPFTFRAAPDCKIGIIDHPQLKELFQKNTDFVTEFMAWQNYMKRFTQMKLRDLLFHGKDGALAAFILRISNTFGVKKNDFISITQKFTNSDIAEMIGASRETANRLLIAFKKKGIIAYKNGLIDVLDIDQLKALCHCEECPASICRL